MQRSIVPVILSGGSGTRLWPLSRELKPKQFLPLVSERTLLQETAQRALGLGSEVRPPIVVCNEAHRFLVAEQLRAVDITPEHILLEPAGRNTAPAVAVAALAAMRSAQASGDDPLLLVLPADQVILDHARFAAAVAAAREAAEVGHLVTFGVVPDRPETGYGYILAGVDRGRWSTLERFVEKPDRETAAAYVASGRYLWNSGMFFFSARTLLTELERHAPGMASTCERALATAAEDPDFTRLGPAFLECESISIDYAVMEKTSTAAVVPLAAGWSDIGSWLALHEVLPRDAHGNAVSGDVWLRGCRDTYVASTGRIVAAVGLDSVVIVETADAVLVMARDHSQAVKDVVADLKAARRDDLTRTPPHD